MNAPLFTSVIFSIVLLILPSYTPGVVNLTLALVMSFGFFIPLLFRSAIIRSAGSFFETNHLLGKKYLSIQGLMYLSIVQVIAILCSLDYLLSQIFGIAHHVLLIGLIVIAGLISVTGRSTTNRTTNLAASALMLAGLLLLLVNRVYLHAPLHSMFNPEVFREYSNSAFVSIFRANTMVSVTGVSVIIFWLMWLELSEMRRKQQTPDDSGLVRSLIGSGVFLIGIFLALAQDTLPAGSPVKETGNSFSMLVVMCVVFGLIGLLISTFVSIGRLFSETVYPLYMGAADTEKQVLLSKLTTVFAVILSILLIPVVRNFGGAVIVWYIHFLALCSSPIVAAFIIHLTDAHKRPFIISMSILLGTSYALVEFILHVAFGIDLFVEAPNVFVVTVASGAVTVLSYVFMEKTGELITVKKLLARIVNSKII
jgi:hypothetical protein